jgi:hypothetical protein
LLNRFDQILRVSPKSFMSEPHRVAARQRPQCFRQIFRMRHLRVADKHRNDALSLI